ncbi:MAG: bifunctional 4-hydroxy-2-oxoglutarate aldolase/2-dehydro-3-deoxy-phosphogluconate aldolase, partial [Eubacterium sp.]
MKKEILSRFEQIGIVPVVVLEDATHAVPLAKALVEGGLPCAEVTFRTAAAAQCIQQMRKAFPDMLVGAGTVVSVEQVDAAVDAGAQFVVSPGLNPEVVRYCLLKEIPIIPGAVTPSEMEQAMALGITELKFFPSEPSGGLPMIKAVTAPYPKLRFMPTGGITPQNVEDYLSFDK